MERGSRGPTCSLLASLQSAFPPGQTAPVVFNPSPASQMNTPSQPRQVRGLLGRAGGRLFSPPCPEEALGRPQGCSGSWQPRGSRGAGWVDNLLPSRLSAAAGAKPDPRAVGQSREAWAELSRPGTAGSRLLRPRGWAGHWGAASTLFLVRWPWGMLCPLSDCALLSSRSFLP